jgi:adenosylcobinamide-GDP ribazoletransferase
MSLRDGWRLALGTLTRIPVRPPEVIDGRTAGTAMLMAPLASLPLAAGVAVLVWLGSQGVLTALAVGLLATGFVAWATRMLHLDGLSDTVDGLTSSLDRVRALEVMRSGTAGPSGVVALIVVIGVQAVSFAALTGHEFGPFLAAACVVASRSALAVACTRGIPAARSEGLGATVAGTVHPLAAGLLTLASAGLVWGAALLPGFDLAGLLAPALAALALVGVLVVARRRLGGVTGDVLGACVEVTLAVLLLCVA